MPITPRFSVVIPTRGDAPHLRRALESVLAQEADLQALVAFSEEAPLPPAAIADPRIVAIGSATRTPGARRNAALARAEAPYVAFLDDDDLWLPGHLAAAAAILDRDPRILAVATDAWLFDDDSAGGSGEPGDVASLPRFLGEGPDFDLTPHDLLVRNVVLTPTVVARRDALEAAGRFDGTLATMEDWDLWLRLAALGGFRFLREPRVIVRRRPGSASRDGRAMAACALMVAARALGLGVALTGEERSTLFGRLWHDLAYASLRAGDREKARAAARHAISQAPGRIKNYVYWLSSFAPARVSQGALGEVSPREPSF